MNPQIRHAQRACEAAKARQAVVVWFDEHGQHAVASYGETKAECTAVKPVCNAIADALDAGDIQRPGNGGGRRKSERQKELEAMADAHDEWKERALVAEQRLASITTLVSIYDNQDEPEGQVSARRALTAIGETIGQPCSICRSRHGSDVFIALQWCSFAPDEGGRGLKRMCAMLPNEERGEHGTENASSCSGPNGEAQMLLTASRLATYQRCPREHELYYLKGYRPVAPVATMRLGTLVHSGLEQWWQGQPVSLPVDADPWDLARARPMLAGYTARWERSEYVTLAVEVEFEAPLKGRDWSLGGRIDAIVRDGQGRDWVVEHKTAGVDISRGSTYWQRLSLDSQVGIYMLGAARLGFNPCGVIYDVLGKPQLRPYEVNSRRVEAETPAQFETRVAAAIAADPDRYYQRGELVRTSEEMAEVMSDLLGVVNLMGVDEYAVRNPGACERYGRICGFFPVCSRQASLLDERLFRHSNVVNPELSGIQTKEVSE